MSFLNSAFSLFYQTIIEILYYTFPGCSEVKVFASNAGDLSSIPGSGSSPGKGNGNPLQYSCLENPKDGETWRATVLGVSELGVTERLPYTHVECRGSLRLVAPSRSPSCFSLFIPLQRPRTRSFPRAILPTSLHLAGLSECIVADPYL